MTSKNATSVTDMVIEVATVPDSIHAGFRQEWVAAEDGDIKATLTSGAGLGSPYMVLTVEREGKPTIYETVDVRTFLPGWIDAAVARAEASS
jgi:hypothetical protein